jgi:hypothetical protein
MEKKVEEVLNDIDSIKNVIESSKTQYKGLYRLSIVFGIYNLIRIFIVLVDFYSQAVDIVAISSVILLDVSFVIVYLLIYRAERKHMNSYYLSVLNIWSLLAIIFPIITRIMPIIGGLFSDEIQERVVMLNTNWDPYVILFAIFLIICAGILKNKILIFASIASILIYYIIYAFYFDTTIQIGILGDTNFALPGIYYIFINIIYILVGVLLKKREDCYEEL